MKRGKYRGRLMRAAICTLLLDCFLLCGCGAAGGKSEAAGKLPNGEGDGEEKETAVTLLLAAAASLEASMEGELISLFEKEYPGILVEGCYDSSGKLMSQIENGLAADVFLSAAEKQMDQLAGEGLVEADSVFPFLENKLVLIVPAGREADYTQFSDIQKAAYPAVGDPDSVPAGQYAKEALLTLGVWEEISQKCSYGTNVTEVLNWVESGSADAGVVYATDAALSERAAVAAEAPEGALAEKIVYPAGIIGASPHQKEAKLFLDFLRSEEAAEIFREYGFTPAGTDLGAEEREEEPG